MYEGLREADYDKTQSEGIATFLGILGVVVAVLFSALMAPASSRRPRSRGSVPW